MAADRRYGHELKFFEETDPCWLRLDRLGALGRMTFSLLRGTDTAHTIVSTLAQEIAALIDSAR